MFTIQEMISAPSGINETALAELSDRLWRMGSLPELKTAFENVLQSFPEFPIGYRRNLITESFGPLRLTLPGSYLYEWDESGSGTNVWYDDLENTPVWRVSGFQNTQEDAQFSERFGKGLHDLTEREIPNGRIRCGWQKVSEPDCTYWIVQAQVISGTWSYLITVAHDTPEERAGIEELLGRITAVARNRP